MVVAYVPVYRVPVSESWVRGAAGYLNKIEWGLGDKLWEVIKKPVNELTEEDINLLLLACRLTGEHPKQVLDGVYDYLVKRYGDVLRKLQKLVEVEVATRHYLTKEVINGQPWYVSLGGDLMVFVPENEKEMRRVIDNIKSMQFMKEYEPEKIKFYITVNNPELYKLKEHGIPYIQGEKLGKYSPEPYNIYEYYLFVPFTKEVFSKLKEAGIEDKPLQPLLTIPFIGGKPKPVWYRYLASILYKFGMPEKIYMSTIVPPGGAPIFLKYKDMIIKIKPYMAVVSGA